MFIYKDGINNIYNCIGYYIWLKNLFRYLILRWIRVYFNMLKIVLFN